MRDPKYRPQIVGFPYNEDPNEVPLISETPYTAVCMYASIRCANTVRPFCLLLSAFRPHGALMLTMNTQTNTYVCVYIYTSTYIYICVYIYMYDTLILHFLTLFYIILNATERGEDKVKKR